MLRIKPFPFLTKSEERKNVCIDQDGFLHSTTSHINHMRIIFKLIGRIVDFIAKGRMGWKSIL